MGFKVQLTPALFAQVKAFVAAFHVIWTVSQLVSLFFGATDKSIWYQPMIPGTRFSSLFCTPPNEDVMGEVAGADNEERAAGGGGAGGGAPGKIEPMAWPYLGAANSKIEAMRCNLIVELGSSSEF